MRELPERGAVNLPRDHEPILYVASSVWTCHYCRQEESSDARVAWVGVGDGVQLGRCLSCGQKYQAAKPGEAVPTIAEQLEGPF